MTRIVACESDDPSLESDDLDLLIIGCPHHWHRSSNQPGSLARAGSLGPGPRASRGPRFRLAARARPQVTIRRRGRAYGCGRDGGDS